MLYNRQKAIDYANKWAYSRNPQYYNFDRIGGDCTNFVSQCLLAGGAKMNYHKEKGWYYRNANEKSPSWTGVEFLYQFLINNTNVGAFAKEIDREEIAIGDIIQLSFDGESFSHSLIVVKRNTDIFTASHTFDTYLKNIKEYAYERIRYLKIEGIRD